MSQGRSGSLLRKTHLFPLAVALMLLGACNPQDGQDGRSESARAFPTPDRPVSGLSDNKFGTEEERDRRHEADVVMDLAGVRPGMSVADLGAGDGYYTVRLAQRVGSKGRVLAEDIDREANERLGSRVLREGLDNVSIKLGTPEDPSLPEGSFDRIFLMRMYHEVGEPYAFIWKLSPALRKGARIVVFEADRASDDHGIPPALLFCEFSSVGFRLTEFDRKPELQGYVAQFEATGIRPQPEDIVACRISGDTGGQNG